MSNRINKYSLQLGMTDNPGSSFYAGVGEKESISLEQAYNKNYQLKIEISNKIIGKTLKDFYLPNSKKFQIDFPIFELRISDDYSNDVSKYEVLRDDFYYKPKNTNLFTFFKTKTYEFINKSYEFDEKNKKRIFIQSNEKKIDTELKFIDKNNLIVLFTDEIKETNSFANAPYTVFRSLHQKGQGNVLNELKFRRKLMKNPPTIQLEIAPRKGTIKSIRVNKKGEII